VTYLATKSGEGDSSGQIANRDSVRAGDTVTQVVSAPLPVPANVPADTQAQTTIVAAGRNVRAVSGARAAGSGAAATYDREIARLHQILEQRRGDVDPKTVAILEQSMKIIDEAIAQSRAALARDPRSNFLGKQLNSALDRKVELLRTAVLLPSS
jgi:hypothetical protein